jgi:hypothetical protein
MNITQQRLSDSRYPRFFLPVLNFPIMPIFHFFTQMIVLFSFFSLLQPVVLTDRPNSPTATRALSMKEGLQMKRLCMMLATVTLLFGSVGPAKAEFVTSLPGGTVVPMPPVNLFGSGPVTFGPGITWSSAYSFAVFGYTAGYGFAGNGEWDGTLGPMAGTNNAVLPMTFTLSTPVAGIGGFINYAPGFGTPLISVYDTSGNLIESYTPTFATGGGLNTGMFLGFLETTPEIGSFTLSGAYIGLTGLTIQPSAIAATPAPTSITLLGCGGVCLLLFRLRSRIIATRSAVVA